MTATTNGLRNDLATFYALPSEEVVEALTTDPERGLTAEEAARRLQQVGPNRVGGGQRRSRLRMVVDQLRSVVVIVLLVAAVAAAFLGEIVESLAVTAVVVVNTVIGFVTELRAQQALEQVQSETAAQARVVRDGVHALVDLDTLVPGDLVVLEAGEAVPADLRILREDGLVIDEAPLTGESVGVSKDSAALAPEVPLAERANQAFRGTTVQGGQGHGVVVATGTATEIGRIGTLVDSVADTASPLQRKLDALGRVLVLVVLVLACLVAVLGMARGLPTQEVIEIAIALGIAAVPEGLPAVTTLTLALGMLAMARANALVRTLPSVEALGSTTVICTDKTGTLTAGQMTVQRYHFPGGHEIEVEGAGYEPNGAFNGDDRRLDTALRIGMLCGDAILRQDDGTWSILGDPTEGALIVVGTKRGLSTDQLRLDLPEIGRVPYSSERQWMATFHRGAPEVDGTVAYIKGAPARVIDAATRLTDSDGAVRKISPRDREALHAANRTLAERGLRVLAMAWCQAEPPGEDAGLDWLADLVIVGLVGMTDPPRPGVKDAIGECHDAGIRVLMITGDQPATATAVARDLDLDPTGGFITIHARDLRQASNGGISPDTLMAPVFARVTPEDKLRIVESLQKSGEVVAVTGDGVNDAPALRQGDIGVAMGQRGTEAAKQVANMVLRDDNFTTIARAVAEGRRIYDNILKFAQFLFTWNLSEVLLVAGAIALGLPLPLIALQVLFLNIVVDLPPAYALAQEPADPELMKRPPRDPRAPLLSPSFSALLVADAIIMATAALAAYSWALGRMDDTQAQTVAFLAITLVQVPRIFACREQSSSLFGRHRTPNPLLWWTTGGMAGAVVGAVFLPGLSDVLELTSPPAEAWLTLFVATASTVPPLEVVRWVLRRADGARGGERDRSQAASSCGPGRPGRR